MGVMSLCVGMSLYMNVLFEKIINRKEIFLIILTSKLLMLTYKYTVFETV